MFEVKKERVEYWISVGAQPSDTVNNLLVDAKILTDKRDIKYSREKLKDEKEAVKVEVPKVDNPEVTDSATTTEDLSQTEAVKAEETESAPEVKEEEKLEETE